MHPVKTQIRLDLRKYLKFSFVHVNSGDSDKLDESQYSLKAQNISLVVSRCTSRKQVRFNEDPLTPHLYIVKLGLPGYT